MTVGIRLGAATLHTAGEAVEANRQVGVNHLMPLASSRPVTLGI